MRRRKRDADRYFLEGILREFGSSGCGSGGGGLERSNLSPADIGRGVGARALRQREQGRNDLVDGVWRTMPPSCRQVPCRQRR